MYIHFLGLDLQGVKKDWTPEFLDLVITIFLQLLQLKNKLFITNLFLKWGKYVFVDQLELKLNVFIIVKVIHLEID